MGSSISAATGSRFRARSALVAPDNVETDAQLMREVQDGRTAALETLFHRHISQAVRVATNILCDHDLAEEVAQEAFYRVWQRAHQFEAQRGSFVNWLLGIVRHLALDEFDRRKNFSLFEYDPDIDSEPPAPDQIAENIAESVLDRVQTEHIWEAVTSLPWPQREVIELSYMHGLTRQQIARRLGEPLGTVHTRAALGLRKLRMLVGAG
jgi:RNA polymerase sigma-70 factor (ECF subfamily)